MPQIIVEIPPAICHFCQEIKILLNLFVFYLTLLFHIKTFKATEDVKQYVYTGITKIYIKCENLLPSRAEARER